jgi:NAD+ kinase
MAAFRVLVVHRRSVYDDLMMNGGKRSRLGDLVKAGDPLVQDIARAHANHQDAMSKVALALGGMGCDSLWLHHLGETRPDDFDLVVAVGGDGTVLRISHAVEKAPILAVNSSPATSVGFFAAATAETFPKVLSQVMDGSFEPVRLARMEVRVNDRVVSNRALNDVLFCNACPASTTRYALTYGGQTEEQLSSGVWVATAAGSTAAIFAAGGRPQRPRSRRLQFVVREAYPRGGAERRAKPVLVNGFVHAEDALTIRSKTENARLYVDGPHIVVPVEFGDEISYGRSAADLLLYGYREVELPPA